ncbi:MAG: alpha/beta fold hydrolase [Stenotrophobium sp.]
MPNLTMRDGARLHYLDIGRGAPVVLLHGFAMQSAMWLPLIAPLAHRYRFILPDFRGWGQSHKLKLSAPTVLDQHAHDVADLLDGLGLDRVHLAGLSMGACTALQYNKLYGFDRVHAYLHMDQALCVPNKPDWQHGLLSGQQQQWFRRWRELNHQILAGGRDIPFKDIPQHLRRELFNSLGDFIGHAFHQPLWRALRHVARYEQVMSRVMPTANWPIYIDTMETYINGNYDWRDSATSIRVPTTVLVGMKSQLYPAEGQLKFTDYVPHARIVRVKNSGHVIPFEAPALFIREMARFLAGPRAMPRLAKAA